MKARSCQEILKVVRGAGRVFVDADNALAKFTVAVDKNDLEKELLHLCQGNTKLPSGFNARVNRKEGKRNRYDVTLTADVNQLA